MKKASLLLLSFLLFSVLAKAQDIITMTSGTTLQAKVLEINPDNVKYKDFNNIDGPTITIQKSDVASIQYANGTKTVFNGTVPPGSEGYKRGDSYSSSGGYRRRPERNSTVHGWYFGLNLNLGASSMTSNDPTYSPSGGSYSGANFLATKMFNEHMGIQFGIGTETYDFSADFNGNSAYAGQTDEISLNSLIIPVRFLYLSNSKKRTGLFVSAGFDMSFLMAAGDQWGNDLTNYYNSVEFSPYISSGVAFRNRNARGLWMFGLYYRSTVNNFYSGQQDNYGLFDPNNSGIANSIGLSIQYMGKFGRSW